MRAPRVDAASARTAAAATATTAAAAATSAATEASATAAAAATATSAATTAAAAAFQFVYVLLPAGPRGGARLGLGATAEPEKPSQPIDLSDPFERYRQQRAGRYHEVMAAQ